MDNSKASTIQGRADGEDSMWLDWCSAAPRIYENIYYRSNPLVAYINRAGHRLVEKHFNDRVGFGNVLEVGAGTGMHFGYVRHRYDNYLATDISPDLLKLASETAGNIGFKSASFEVADATGLPYEDNSFNRLISVYNLEHLPFPHLVLKEWKRVVAPGGIISIAIPTEGGIAWNLGRFLTTRRSFAKQGLDLDYIISREHINACYRLVALIRHYFPVRQEMWFPTGIPIAHANLIYAVNVKVVKND